MSIKSRIKNIIYGEEVTAIPWAIMTVLFTLTVGDACII